MRKFVPLALALALLLAMVPQAWARVVVIEATVPLADDSEETLKSAIKKAIEKAVRGATALGLRSTGIPKICIRDGSCVGLQSSFVGHGVLGLFQDMKLVKSLVSSDVGCRESGLPSHSPIPHRGGFSPQWSGPLWTTQGSWMQ